MEQYQPPRAYQEAEDKYNEGKKQSKKQEKQNGTDNHNSNVPNSICEI